VVGSSLFCLAYLRWHVHEPWSTSGFVAVSLGASVQLIFGLLLGAQLHTGWLWHLAH
jgi:ABC-type cobalamin transport system permease subunit